MTEFHKGYELWIDDNSGQPCVWSNKSNKWMKDSLETYGYKQVLCQRKSYRLHQLVAKYYVDNSDPENKTMVDHINGDRQDNRAENLRWVTRSGNNYNVNKKGYKYFQLNGHEYWQARFKIPDGKRVAKYFPYTDEGEQQARDWYLEQREKYKDIIYE